MPLWPEDAKPRLLLFVNLFTREGRLPPDQETVLHHLIEAVACSRLARPQVVARVAPADLPAISERLAGVNDLAVEVLGPDSQQRRLPLLRDILQGSAAAVAAAHQEAASPLPPYALYINADICLPPYAFDLVAQQVMQASRARASADRPGWLPAESLIINRRDRLAARPGEPGPSQLDWHPGYDCFAFPLALLPRLQLGETCVGLPPIGALLALNLLVLSKRVLLIDELFLSWHAGSDRQWNTAEQQGAITANWDAAAAAFRRLTRHDPRVLAQLPFVGFEKRLAGYSYRPLTAEFAKKSFAPGQ
ncbi:MAG: hypothetical protein VKN56_03345 [Cyanobacteriota bacterium]|nr:hypothetical protein [Cyanobacteriota bacterium]